MKTCPRAIEDQGTNAISFEFLNKPDDGTCDYCGSLFGDEFMKRLEAGDVELGPTDKSYKVYVHNIGGKPFLQSHRIDEPSKPGEIMKDPMDQSHWTWTTREMQQCKFYFQHLSVDQQRRFIELLNAKKLKIGMPGHFYVRPFFCIPQDTAK
jgi:hypothetical protein